MTRPIHHDEKSRVNRHSQAVNGGKQAAKECCQASHCERSTDNRELLTDNRKLSTTSFPSQAGNVTKSSAKCVLQACRRKLSTGLVISRAGKCVRHLDKLAGSAHHATGDLSWVGKQTN